MQFSDQALLQRRRLAEAWRRSQSEASFAYLCSFEGTGYRPCHAISLTPAQHWREKKSGEASTQHPKG